MRPRHPYPYVAQQPTPFGANLRALTLTQENPAHA